MSSQPGCLAATVLLLGAAAWAEPSPGIGLLVKPGEMPALRTPRPRRIDGRAQTE
jgi:hypothetical protein